MIDLEGKGYLKVDITGLPDIVDTSINFDIMIKESAGNIMPVMMLQLVLPTPVYDYVINEGTELILTIGPSRDTAKISRWKFYNWEINQASLSAILSPIRDYVNDTTIETINSNSLSAIKTVASRYFTFDIDQKVFYADKMKWISYRMSPRDFIDQIWLHSYSASHFIIPGIIAQTYIGKPLNPIFKVKDIKDKSNPLKLSDDPESDLKILVNATFSSNSGTYNQGIGVIKNSEISIDDPDYLIDPENPSPIFGEKFNRSGYSSKVIRSYFKSDNVHDHFFDAAIKNVNQLAQFGGFAKKLSVLDLKNQVEILDIINTSIPYAGTHHASELQSGYYVVSDVITRMKNQAGFSKEIILRRDAFTMAKVQGNFV